MEKLLGYVVLEYLIGLRLQKYKTKSFAYIKPAKNMNDLKN